MKTYEAPKAEVIEIESQGVVMAASGGGESTPDGITFQRFGE